MKDKLKLFIWYLIVLIYSGIYHIFCSFSIKKNRIFLNVYDGQGYCDNPKYIVDKLLIIKPNIEIIYLDKSKQNIDIPSFKVKSIRPYSIKSLYYQATAKIWISTVRMPYYSVKRKDQVYFQTWHGSFGFKFVEQDCQNVLSLRYVKTAKKDSKMIDYYVSDNEDQTKLFLDSFWYSGGEILKYGSPRNDVYFTYSEEDVKNIKIKYQLIGKKIALYAPTFRADKSLKSYNIDFNMLLNCLENKFGGDWIIIIRLHPFIANISKNLCYDDKIINGTNWNDNQELLLISDLLISDYSSISFDFMNTCRPIIIYASDIEEYKKDRDFRFKLENAPFPIATNNKELEQIIFDFNYENYKSNINEFKNKYNFYGDGHSSEKCAKIIQEVMEK